MKRLVLIFGLAAISIGCHPNTPIVTSPAAPPKASVDLQIANSLLVAQSAIEQAKNLIATKPDLKAPLNQVIALYNDIESLYLVFHKSIVSGGNPDPTELLNKTSNLAAIISVMANSFNK